MGLSEEHTAAENAAIVGIPMNVAQPTLVAYRSFGIGVFGAIMRFSGMPLEKIALFMNSSQVSGNNQFSQAIRLTFREGALSPYRVVGPASMTAWFLQYSVMGVAFQFVDQTLSQLLGVRPVYYGKELMDAPVSTIDEPFSDRVKFAVKTFLSPLLAASLESKVSNRAESQRYFGHAKFAAIEKAMAPNLLVRVAGPAFGVNCMRNIIMCNTSFILTPITYKLYFPQEQKSKSTFFWYGLGMNMFVGNVFAITQQSLWGRSLDYLAENGTLSYRSVIRNSLQKEGLAAFFTVPKWFSRVLMNAPAQGTLPWFYNEVLPMGELAVLKATKGYIYDPFFRQEQVSFARTGTATRVTAGAEFTASSPR
jgi:hypothetical protein